MKNYLKNEYLGNVFCFHIVARKRDANINAGVSFIPAILTSSEERRRQKEKKKEGKVKEKGAVLLPLLGIT